MDRHMDNKDHAKLGLAITRHSLTTFGKRRPFSRKPSSWRHPGGTVSETEETDFSECDETGAEQELERRKPNHVHSFTFSSLSMFRSKQRHSSGDGTSQLSFEGVGEEGGTDGPGDARKQMVSPSRSHNRKFKEATDKVRDNLRAYAQRFKENRERDSSRSEVGGGRSSSAGREETIEEETSEDVEAERSGVTRAYSLNCGQMTKPLLQSHSSTESTDVPTTPSTSPTRTKKKLSLKNRKSGELDPNIQALHKRNAKISKSETPKKDHSLRLQDRAESSCLTLAQPEVFRQAILEVDTLTEKCVEEADIESNEGVTGPAPRHQVMTDKSSDETLLTLTSDRRCLAYTAQCQGEDTETGDSEEENMIRVKSTQTKKWSPCQSEQLGGQRSRQGSKRKRKKDSANSGGKINSPTGPGLKLCMTSPETRSASYSSLSTQSQDETCLSSSPSPHLSNPPADPGHRSPQIIFTGSSTLPRSTSENRRLEQMTEPSSTSSNQTSILTLQLEGPYGRSMSISDGNSREDTISPMMVSQKTGVGSSESTETLTNIEDTVLDTTERLQPQPLASPGDQPDLKNERRNLTSCGLLYPGLMKKADQVVTRSAVISHQDREEEPTEEVVETFQTGPEYCQDGSLMNEIKIAEIVQMTCEEADEGSLVCLYKEGEFRAEIIEAESELDEEVAQLMESDTARLQTDNVKLIVQDYDRAEGGDGGDTTEAEADLPDLGWVNDYRSNIRPEDRRSWDKPQPKVLFPKSATFPRQSQKVEDQETVENGLYYLREHHHHQYNYIQNFHPYRGQDDIETDIEDEEATNTIQEAIKQEAKKLDPSSANQENIYHFSEKEFLLPGKVYGSNFKKHSQDCYQIPDGFVTPLRVTPHRNLTSSPPAEEGGKRDPARMTQGRQSRRQLRGPFGQLLMDEMAKSERCKPEEEVGPSPSHQRTRSSPSHMEFSQINQSPELNFANLSGDKLRVAQELLVPRLAARREEVSKQQTLGSSASFRRPKDTRALIVREIFNVEKSYVDSLQFLVIKYLTPLKNPENSHIIDNVLVDDIFFQIPNILFLHEGFLEDLKRRLENWDSKKTIGDWFLDSFTKKVVVDAYTGFIRNVKRADDAIKIARTTKPAFDRFLQDMRRGKVERLSLTDLLAKPFQRIPRYRLLLQRLMEHTEQDHADFPLLRRAEKEIHELALKINNVEKESNEQEVRQQQLRQLEVLIHGLAHNDLVAPARSLLRHDLVTTSTSPWIRKDRCLFLFNDIILITSVGRRGARDIKRSISSSPHSLSSSLEMCRHKLWMYLTLSDTKEENLKKMMKEYGDIENDLKIVQGISDQAARLRCPHKELDESVKSLLGNLTKQVSERQASEMSHASFLQLNINTSDGLETLNVAFDTPERKGEWEDAFMKAKEKLEDSGAAPPPDLLSLIPIRKTRAGLQFTCAAPTIGLNSHNLKDVWVCNSDGYVGQVCVLSLKPEPTVVCCNGVCNARIMSIVSVPNLPTPAWTGWSTPPTSTAGWSTPDSSTLDWSAANKHKPWIGSDGGTAESSPQSGNAGHLDIEEDDVTSDDEEDEMEAVTGKQNFIAIEHESNSSQATMWLGTEDGTIHVYNCTDNIRIKKNKDKFCHSAPVLSILYLNNKVFASLGNGHIVIYSRDSSGVWDKTGFECLTVGSATYPVTRMVVVAGNIWAGTSNTIKILNPASREIEDVITVGSEESKVILAIVESGLGVWIAQQGASSVKLIHATNFICLAEISLTSSVAKMLSGCDEIIRQHKTACLRVTSLLAVKDMLWVGTSAGVILTLPLPSISQTTTKLQTIPPLTGIPHGHTGHVRFLTCVEMSGETGGLAASRGPGLARLARKEGGVSAAGLGVGSVARILVISGGDGYEEFTSSASSELAGREDSTNHLLLWVV